MLKRILAAICAVVLVAGTGISAASAYEGGWRFQDNPGGTERFDLGDNTDNSYYGLDGTSAWCGRRGASYATMRGILSRNRGHQITWWIADVCYEKGVEYNRVCVENTYGESACSTYIVYGWYWE